jgi:UDP-N-acetylmuramoylalanine--D-glutamate ligase
MIGKNILVYGTGVSGIAAVKALNKLGKKIFIFDDKKSLEDILDIQEIKDIKFKFLNNIKEIDFLEIDLIIKSPSVPLESNLIIESKIRNIPVVSDLELAYRLTDKDFIAITGTNGKTTTTTLVHKIISDNDFKAGLTGNIGSGILWDVLDDKDLYIVESSSYQLASINRFKPKIAVITNITPDHLNWHESFENYINAKLNIFKNQDENDYVVLNYEDEVIKDNLEKIRSKIIFFSSKRKLSEGIFINGEEIQYKRNDEVTNVINLKDIKIPGTHNLENVMAAIGVSVALNLNLDKVKESIQGFKGVEHRLELVDSKLDNVLFFNDSKGTNPASTIKAVEALKENIIIILGGYNKNSSFDDLVKIFKGKVKYVVLFGETKEIIKEALNRQGFSNYTVVKNLEEAVKKAYTVSTPDDKILLSPACASWDMYSSFEERGKHFKEIIKLIEKDDLYGKNQ